MQTPMENNHPMAAKIKGKQGPQVHDYSPILGCKCMVAPNSETARQGDPRFFDRIRMLRIRFLLSSNGG